VSWLCLDYITRRDILVPTRHPNDAEKMKVLSTQVRSKDGARIMDKSALVTARVADASTASTTV
jgi:hypothetical protein